MGKVFVTRPRLAYNLAAAGIQGLRVTNVYDPSRPAWVYDATPETLIVIKAYYHAVGVSLPPYIQKFIEEAGI